MRMPAATEIAAPYIPAPNLLNSKVLVLNRSYLPVHVTSVKRAFALLYQGVAKAVDDQYHTFDFDSWRDLALEVGHERLGVVNGFIRVPRVLLLTAYERVPKRHVRFSRFNIFARDGNTCQYCNRRLPRPEWTPFSTEMFSLKHYREWMPYLSQVDSAYWNTELIQD